MNTTDKTYEGLIQMIFVTQKLIFLLKLNIEFKQMVNTTQFGRRGKKGGRGGNKISGVQVNKCYVKIKYIDDKCFFRNFSM
jgi:hypothetical protein